MCLAVLDPEFFDRAGSCDPDALKSQKDSLKNPDQTGSSRFGALGSTPEAPEAAGLGLRVVPRRTAPLRERNRAPVHKSASDFGELE
jgi:hypothetical protein